MFYLNSILKSNKKDLFERIILFLLNKNNNIIFNTFNYYEVKFL